MAIMGLPNCSCFMPVATQRARAPAILRPSVHTALRNGCFIASIINTFLLGGVDEHSHTVEVNLLGERVGGTHTLDSNAIRGYLVTVDQGRHH